MLIDTISPDWIDVGLIERFDRENFAGVGLDLGGSGNLGGTAVVQLTNNAKTRSKMKKW